MRTWADDFRTYDDACRYYGCDTPAQVEAEERMWAIQEAIGGHPHVYSNADESVNYIEIENYNGAVVRTSPTFTTRLAACDWLRAEEKAAADRIDAECAASIASRPAPTVVDDWDMPF